MSIFRCLAALNLEKANSSSTLIVGQILGITMLKNANLDESTLNNVKLYFINLKESYANEKKLQYSVKMRKL